MMTSFELLTVDAAAGHAVSGERDLDGTLAFGSFEGVAAQPA